MRLDARAIIVAGDGGAANPNVFTPGARKAIEDAFGEARAEKVHKITPKHLLTALSLGEGRAARVLQLSGLTPEWLRALR